MDSKNVRPVVDSSNTLGNLDLFQALDKYVADNGDVDTRSLATLARQILQFKKDLDSGIASFEGKTKDTVTKLDFVIKGLNKLGSGKDIKSLVSSANSVKGAIASLNTVTEKTTAGAKTQLDNVANSLNKAVEGIKSVPTTTKAQKLPGLKFSEVEYNKALAAVREHNKASIAMIQREAEVGRTAAKNILDQMEKAGIVSKPGAGSRRQVLQSRSTVPASRIRELRNILEPLDKRQRALAPDIYRAIKDPKIRDTSIEAIKYFPDEFFSNSTAPGGLHHPDWQRGQGGNVAHTRDLLAEIAAARANKQTELLEQLQKRSKAINKPITGADFDKAAMAALLHDADKFNINLKDPSTDWYKTDPRHELNPFGRMLPEEFKGKMRAQLGEATFNEIQSAVESHGAKYLKGVDEKLDTPRIQKARKTIDESFAAYMVNIADGISSDLLRENQLDKEHRVSRLLNNPTPKEREIANALIDRDLRAGTTGEGVTTQAAKLRVWEQWQKSVLAKGGLPEATTTQLKIGGLAPKIVDPNLQALISTGGRLHEIQSGLGANPKNLVQYLVDLESSLKNTDIKNRRMLIDPDLAQLQYVNPNALGAVSEYLRSSKDPTSASAVQNLSKMIDESLKISVRNATRDGKVDVLGVTRSIPKDFTKISENVKAQIDKRLTKEVVTAQGIKSDISARRINRDASDKDYKATVEERNAAKLHAAGLRQLTKLEAELANLYKTTIKTYRLRSFGSVKGGGQNLPVARPSVPFAENVMRDLKGQTLGVGQIALIQRASEEVRRRIAQESIKQTEMQNRNLTLYGRPTVPPPSFPRGPGGGGPGGGGPGGGGPGGGSIRGTLWNLKNNAFAMALPLSGIGSFVQLVRTATDAVKEHELAVTNLTRVWDGSMEDLTKAGDALTDTAIKYGDSIANVGVIQEEWAKTGVKDFQELKDLVSTTELTLNTSDITDAGSAVKYLNSSLVQMQLPLSDANRLLDSWNKTADKFPADTKDFAEAYQRSGAYAKNLGLDMHDLNSIISIMIERTGRSGEEVGTALRMMFSNIYIPKSIKVLEGMGIEMHQMGEDGKELPNKFRPFVDIIRDMSTKAGEFKATVGPSLLSPRSVETLEKLGVQMYELDNTGTKIPGRFREIEDILANIKALGIDTKTLGLPTDVSVGLTSMAKTLGETRRMNFSLALIEGFDEFERVRKISAESAGYSAKKNEMTMQTITKQALQLKAAMGETAVTFGEAGLLSLLKGLTQVGTATLTTFTGLDQRLPLVNTQLKDLISMWVLYQATLLAVNKATKSLMGTSLTAQLGDQVRRVLDVTAGGKRGNIGPINKYNAVFDRAMSNTDLIAVAPDTTERANIVKQQMASMGMVNVARKEQIALTNQAIAVGNIETTVMAKNVSMTQARITAMNGELAVTAAGNVYRRNSAGTYVLDANAKATDAAVTTALTGAEVNNAEAVVLSNAATGRGVLVHEASAVAKANEMAATRGLAAAQAASVAASTAMSVGVSALIVGVGLLAYAMINAKKNARELNKEIYESAMTTQRELSQLTALVREQDQLSLVVDKATESLESKKRVLSDLTEAEGSSTTSKLSLVKAENDVKAAQSELNKARESGLDIAQKITEVNPSLITGYNSEGMAIAANTEEIEKYIDAKRRMNEMNLESGAIAYKANAEELKASIEENERRLELLSILSRKEDFESDLPWLKQSGIQPGSGLVFGTDREESLERYFESGTEQAKKDKKKYEELMKDMTSIDMDLGISTKNVLGITTDNQAIAESMKVIGERLAEERTSLSQSKAVWDQYRIAKVRAAMGMSPEDTDKETAALVTKSKQQISLAQSVREDAENVISFDDTSKVEKYLNIVKTSKNIYTQNYMAAVDYLRENSEGVQELIGSNVTASYKNMKKVSIEAIQAAVNKDIELSRDATTERIRASKKSTRAIIEDIDARIRALKAEAQVFNLLTSFASGKDKPAYKSGPTQPGDSLSTFNKAVYAYTKGGKDKDPKAYADDVKAAAAKGSAQREVEIAALEAASAELRVSQVQDTEAIDRVIQPIDTQFSGGGETDKYKELNKRLRTLENSIKSLRNELQALDTLWQGDTKHIEYLTAKSIKLAEVENRLTNNIGRLSAELKGLSPESDADKYTEIQEKITEYTQSLYDNMRAQVELSRVSFQGRIEDIDDRVSSLNDQLTLNTQALTVSSGSYDAASLKLGLYREVMATTEEKAKAIRAELARVTDEMVKGADVANSSGSSFRTLFNSIDAKTSGEYVKQLNELLEDTNLELSNNQKVFEDFIVSTLKEGYNKQLEEANKRIDDNIKKERKRHEDFTKNKQKELKQLDEQWKKEDRDEKLAELDEQKRKVDIKIAKLRNDTSQYAAKLRKQLEEELGKIQDQKNEMAKTEMREGQQKAIQDKIDADKEASEKTLELYENEKTAAGEHFKTLVDNAEGYGKGLVEVHKKTQFDIISFLYKMFPEYENVAKGIANAYQRGLQLNRPLAPVDVANLYIDGLNTDQGKALLEQLRTTTEEAGRENILAQIEKLREEAAKDYNQFITNGNLWMEAIASGKATTGPEFARAKDINEDLRQKYNIPNEAYPSIGLDYNMAKESIDKMYENSKEWKDLQLELGKNRIAIDNLSKNIASIDLDPEQKKNLEAEVARLEARNREIQAKQNELNIANNVIRQANNLPIGGMPSNEGYKGLSPSQIETFLNRGREWKSLNQSGDRSPETLARMSELQRLNNLDRSSIGVSSTWYPNQAEGGHEYNITAADKKTMESNGAQWRELASITPRTQEIQSKMSALSAANDAIRKLYGIPDGAYPRFKGGGIMPYTGMAMLEEREMILPERYTKLLDALVTSSPRLPTGATTGGLVINNQVRVDKALNIENATFQDPVDYDKVEDMAGRRLRESLLKKGIRS